MLNRKKETWCVGFLVLLLKDSQHLLGETKYSHNASDAIEQISLLQGMWLKTLQLKGYSEDCLQRSKSTRSHLILTSQNGRAQSFHYTSSWYFSKIWSFGFSWLLPRELNWRILPSCFLVLSQQGLYRIDCALPCLSEPWVSTPLGAKPLHRLYNFSRNEVC